jgi:hypothetical protein
MQKGQHILRSEHLETQMTISLFLLVSLSLFLCRDYICIYIMRPEFHSPLRVCAYGTPLLIPHILFVVSLTSIELQLRLTS